MELISRKTLYADYAARAYRNSDTGRWVAAFWSARVVGKYQNGTTKSLAQHIGVSVDTIENLSHAYEMYAALRADAEFSRQTRLARKQRWVYTSHFAALYKAWKRYGLDLWEVYSILIDIVQGRGEISSRDVDMHVREHYGKERDWQYYASRTISALFNLRQCPDVPGEIRVKVDDLYSYLGENA